MSQNSEDRRSQMTRSITPGSNERLKILHLHPDSYNLNHSVMVTVSKATDSVKLRRFELVDASDQSQNSFTPLVVDEEKPGIRGFDLLWAKDGSLSTFQVIKIAPKFN